MSASLFSLTTLLSASRLTVETLQPPDKLLSFGAVVRGLDLADPLSEDDVAMLEAALADHGLLVLEGAAHPTVEAERFSNLVRQLNPGAETTWRDQQTNPWERYKADHMGPAGTFNLPSCHDVLVLGKGDVEDHFGLTCALGGKRKAYGASGSQVIGGGQLQWHIDGAFWKSPSSPASGLPCRVVGMRCIEAPVPPRTFDVEYGDGATLRCTTGSTAFCSGVRAFQLLTEQERERALRTTVVYAAHPFKRFASCGMTQDGLRCVGDGDTKGAIDDERSGQLRLPLVWTHPESGRPALMPHTRCLESIEIASVDGAGPPTVLDTEMARAFLHGLMRRAVDPSLVFPVAWRAGDCVRDRLECEYIP